MPSPSIESLLSKLAWPGHALPNKGTMTWTNAVEGVPPDGHTVVSSAAILVADNRLTLRCRSAIPGGPMEPLLEAAWSFDGSSRPEMVSAVVNGQPAALDEEAIVGAFQDRVNLLGVRPVFQSFAPRKTSPASPSRPSF